MALTRAFLRGLQLNDEQISAVIEAHSETVDGLKNERAEVQAQLDTANNDLDAFRNGDWERKYNELNSTYEAYKTETAAKTERAKKVDIYKSLLRESGVSEKRIDGILKYDSDAVNGIELTEEGKAANAETLKESIKANWQDFITVTSERGADVPTPPTANAKRYTREDIKGMSPAEINANWADVSAALKGD